MRRPLLLSLALALSVTSLPATALGADECDTVPQVGPRACATVEAARVLGAGACDQPGAVPSDTCGELRGVAVDPALVDAYATSELSTLHRLQRELGTALPLRSAQMLSSHNSYNASSYLPSVASSDPNQLYGIADQLRMDMRQIELDVHSWYASSSSVSPNGVMPVLCHATGPHIGCSADRRLVDGLHEIRGWLDANPGEVIMIDVEDHLDGVAGHDAAASLVEDILGDVLYAPAGKTSCAKLPLETSFDDVAAAGAQVLLVSSCGSGAAWGELVFTYGDWSQGRLGAFEPGSCGPDFDRTTYDTRLTRYWEDTTWLSAMAGGVGPRLEGDTLREAMACGLSLASLDKLHPQDPRLESLLWSWAPGTAAVIPQLGDEAVIGADGRFHVLGRDVPAGDGAALLCRRVDGTLEITSVTAGTVELSVLQQPSLMDLLCGDGELAVPRSAREMQLVRDAIARHEAAVGPLTSPVRIAYAVSVGPGGGYAWAAR